MFRSALKFVFGVEVNPWVLATVVCLFAASVNLGVYMSKEPAPASVMTSPAVLMLGVAAVLYWIAFGIVYYVRMRALFQKGQPHRKISV